MHTLGAPIQKPVHIVSTSATDDRRSLCCHLDPLVRYDVSGRVYFWQIGDNAIADFKGVITGDDTRYHEKTPYVQSNAQVIIMCASTTDRTRKARS